MMPFDIRDIKKIRGIFEPLAAVLRGFFMYAASSLALRLATAIASLVLVRFLTPAEFGLLALINSVLTFVPLCLQWGLRQAFWLEYFHTTGFGRRVMLNRLIIIYVSIAVPASVALWFFAPHLCRLCGVYIGSLIVNLVLIYSFIHFFSELFMQVLRCQMRIRVLVVIQLSAAACMVLMSAILVGWCHWGLTGWLCANTISLVSVCVCAVIFYLASGAPYAWDLTAWWPWSRRMIWLGVPFIPNIACVWIAMTAMRWLLASYVDLAAVGVYAVADIAHQVFNMCILYPLSASYVPYVLGKFSVARSLEVVERDNRRYMWLAMLGTFVIGVCGMLCAQFIGPLVLPTAFAQATTYLFPMVLTNVCLVGTYFASAYLIYHKRMWPLVGAHILWALANLVFGYALIPAWGIWGAVWGQTGAAVIFFAVNLWLNWRELLALQLCGNSGT